MNKNRPVCAGMRPSNAQSPGAESRMNVIRALHTSAITTYIATPKELTEQAYRLYRKLQLDVQVFKFFATGSLEKSSSSPVL